MHQDRKASRVVGYAIYFPQHDCYIGKGDIGECYHLDHRCVFSTLAGAGRDWGEGFKIVEVIAEYRANRYLDRNGMGASQIE